MPVAPEQPSAPSELSLTRNPASPPEDFVDFWRTTLRELLQLAPQPRSLSLDLPPRGQCVVAEMKSLGGAAVRLWFSGPKNHHRGGAARPLLVTCHGYGGRVEAERIRRLARFGMDVVGVDARGFGMSEGAVPRVSPQGYLMTGCSSREESILRGAVCDYIQAYRAAAEWFGRPEHVTFQGFSFAGGLSLMATSVLGMGRDLPGAPPSPQILACGVPTFGYFEKRLELCRDGSGKEMGNYLKAHPERAAEVRKVFQYFDTCFFAPHVRQGAPSGPKRVLFGVGTYDPIVPAETVYAVKNALPEAPELFVMPCSHTDRPEEAEWVKWEGAWIRAARGPSET